MKICRVFVLTLVVFLSQTRALRGEDWPKYRADLSNTGTVVDTGITTSNVGSLKLKWKFNTGATITASPAVATINGTSLVFIGDTHGTFHALNAVTGQQVWSFQIDTVADCAGRAWSCNEIHSSADVVNNIVYFGAHNAFLYALNAANGAVVWKAQLADPGLNYAVWSSPAVYNGLVYVGLANAGNDAPCVDGEVVARNASTGAAVWAFSTIDKSACSGTSCGAGVWASPALDGSTLYVGTGNPCTNPPAPRYPDSILALKLSNGQLLNYYQAVQSDTLDRDFGSSPILLQTAINLSCPGEQIWNWVIEASKDGSAYFLQRGSSGLLLSSLVVVTLDGSNVIASPAGFEHGGGRCATVEDTVIFPTPAGNLFDVLLYGSGKIISKNEVPIVGSYSAPAIIYPSLIFLGSGNNLEVIENGASVFSFATGGAVYSGPAVSNGRVYFGSTDGNLYCLSPNGT